MKIKIKKDLLLKELIRVSNALSSKTLIPALTGVYMKVNNEGLTLIGSDSNITIKTIIEENENYIKEQDGELVVGGRYFIEVIKTLPQDFILLELIDKFKLKITSGKTEFNLNCIDVDDYPEYSFNSADHPLSIKIKDFKKLIEQTIFSISKEEVRPLLTGINFSIENNILKLVATDSYRLSKTSIKLEKEISNLNITVPGENLSALLKTLEEENGTIDIHFMSNNILFTTGKMIFSSRVLNGTYPDIHSLIPESFGLEVECDKKDFHAILARVSLLINEREKNIVHLEKEDSKIILTSSSQEIGKAVDEMEIEPSDKKKNLKISFSARYMLDALNGVDGNKIKLCFNDNSQPIIIKSEQNANLVQLILPIKTY